MKMRVIPSRGSSKAASWSGTKACVYLPHPQPPEQFGSPRHRCPLACVPCTCQGSEPPEPALRPEPQHSPRSPPGRDRAGTRGLRRYRGREFARQPLPAAPAAAPGPPRPVPGPSPARRGALAPCGCGLGKRALRPTDLPAARQAARSGSEGRAPAQRGRPRAAAGCCVRARLALLAGAGSAPVRERLA